MTGRFLRLVSGFPCLAPVVSVVTIAPAATSTINLYGGPGEFLGMALWSYVSSDSAYGAITIVVTVDGVVLYSGDLFKWLVQNRLYAAHGLFSTHEHYSNTNCWSSFAVKIPYDSTFSIAFTNNDASDFNLIISLYARRGA
jgi:hypothetical protein